LAATSKVALTTGNALTVAMGLQGIERGCRVAGVDLKSACVAVVGATGNIGTTYAECMAEQSARLLLIGRRTSQAKLAELADVLYGQAFARLRRAPDGVFGGVSGTIAAIEEVRLLARRPAAASGAEIRTLVDACLGDDAPIAIAGDLEALSGADVILAASNAARPIIEPEHLRSGPLVVCDVAVPRDVSPRVAQLRPDVHVLVGGAVRLPGNPDLDLVAGHLPRGHVYACMAETILLGLEGAHGHFSFGPIRRDAVRDIAALADAHGFTLGVVEDRAEMDRADGSQRRASDRARAI
jgi:predicted amino acid dehydrogenase